MRVLIRILAILPSLVAWLTVPVTAPAFTCDTFRYQEQAQAILAEDPVDPYGLDHDGNGLACDSLPLAGDLAALPEPRPGQGFDLDCLDFAFQDQAQRVYEAAAGDPHGLDPTNDGIACSRLPARAPGNVDGADPAHPPALAGRSAGQSASAEQPSWRGGLEAEPVDPFDGEPDRDVPAGDRQPPRAGDRSGRLIFPLSAETGTEPVEAARVIGDPSAGLAAFGLRQWPRAPSH